MAEQLKITQSNCSKYSNPLHTAFHEAMYSIVSQIEDNDSEKWRINTVMPTWLEHIKTEIDINRETSASAETKLIADLDAERDRLITYLFEMIRVECDYSPKPLRAEAARRLRLVTKEYSGLQREGYNEQTTHLAGLITDFYKEPNFSNLKTLALDEYVGTLELLNEDFKTRMASRSDDRAQTKLPPAKTVRPLTDSAYKQVCDFLVASYLFATDDAERERINSLVRTMNQRTDEFKARHKQATAKSGAEK